MGDNGGGGGSFNDQVNRLTAAVKQCINRNLENTVAALFNISDCKCMPCLDRHPLRMNEYISGSLRKFGSTLAAGIDLSTFVLYKMYGIVSH